MTLEEKMKAGMVFTEWRHTDPVDQALEQELFRQRQECKEKLFDYNNTRPTDVAKKREIMDSILGSHGKSFWMESPVHFSYGSNVHLGESFYSNFNLSIVDDGEVWIGDHVMIGPNVTIAVTGHPMDAEIRLMGTHYSIPIHIGNNVWIGANTVILPGVNIGDNAVIGAGSVVTRDIPGNVLAVGVPCRVLRELGEHDKEYYWRDRKFNWEEGF